MTLKNVRQEFAAVGVAVLVVAVFVVLFLAFIAVGH